MLNRSRAFTLIELLVAIAIISILAAILFPVFAQAREKARSIACLSNMKQIGLGVQMYIQDNDDRIFFRRTTQAGDERAGILTPKASPNYNQLAWWNQIMPYIKSNNVFQCPSDSSPTMSLDANGDPGATGAGTVPRSYIADASAENLTLAQVDDPTETIVVTEKSSAITDSWIEPFNGDFGPDPANPGHPVNVADRHQNFFNCAFFDGHAKATNMAQVLHSKELSGCELIYQYPGASASPSSPATGDMNVNAISNASNLPNICKPNTAPTNFSYP